MQELPLDIPQKHSCLIKAYGLPSYEDVVSFRDLEVPLTKR